MFQYSLFNLSGTFKESCCLLAHRGYAVIGIVLNLLQSNRKKKSLCISILDQFVWFRVGPVCTQFIKVNSAVTHGKKVVQFEL